MRIAPDIARAILSSFTQSCSFSLSTMCSPANTRTKKTSLITTTLLASWSERAWFKVRFANVPRLQVNNTMRQSSLNSVFMRMLAFGISAKLSAVAGKKVAKNVKLTVLKDPRRYFVRIIIRAAKIVDNKTMVIPVIDLGRLNLWIINKPASMTKMVPKSWDQENAAPRIRMPSAKIHTSRSLPSAPTSEASRKVEDLNIKRLWQTINTPISNANNQGPSSFGRCGSLSISGKVMTVPTRL